MPLPTLLELAEAGAHYGHHRSLTSPKSKNFVYMTKNNVSLINLEETRRCLEEAQKLLNQYRVDNRPVLFVGTKRSIRPIVKEIAEAAGLPFIVERWYGGFLTNFTNFALQLKRMKELAEHIESDKAKRLDKRERARLQARLDHYNRFLGGVVNLSKMPELMIVGSATEDKIAIGEARKMGIPVIAISDTDINPLDIDYPIPANDDAPKAIEMILRALVEAPAAKAEKPAKEKAEKTEEETKPAAKKTATKTTKKTTAKTAKTKK